jgi:hypothetical protein
MTNLTVRLTTEIVLELHGALSHSASQEIRGLLWNPKVHYRVHKGPPLVPILNQMHTLHSFPPYFSKIVHFPLPWSFQRIRPSRRPFVHFLTNCFFFNGDELLDSRPIPKFEDYSLSAVSDCLFNIFTAALHICRPSPSSATQGRALIW